MDSAPNAGFLCLRIDFQGLDIEFPYVPAVILINFG